MRNIKLIVAFATIFFSVCPLIFACRFDDYDVPLCSKITNANAVFLGKITKVEPSSSLIQFKVEKTFKGDTESIVDINYDFGTSCSLSPNAFKVNDKFVVFGYGSKFSMTMHICTGFENVTNAPDKNEFYKFLEDFSKGKTKEFVTGKLVKDHHDEGLKKIPITIIGKQKTYRTITNERGFFQVEVNEKGEYLIKFRFPIGFNAVFYQGESKLKTKTNMFSYKAKIEKGLCDYRKMNFTKVLPSLSFSPINFFLNFQN